MNWNIRNAEPDDLAFIYQTWLKSYAASSEIGRSVRQSLFFREYRKVIDRLLFSSGVLIASIHEDDKVILGYLVFEPKVLHYCFIKEAFRFSGIAKSLVEKAMGKEIAHMYTHHTRQLNPIVEKYELLTYNPFLLFKEL